MPWSRANALRWRFSIERRYFMRNLSLFTLVVLLAVASAVPIAAVAELPLATDAKLVKRGKVLWLQCAACHDLAAAQTSDENEDIPKKIGPNLAGVIGRRAGTLKGYSYSEALGKSRLVWGSSTLDQWIEKPAVLVPGTSMVFIGVPREEDRRAIIAYLESVTR